MSHRQWWHILRNFDTAADVREHRGWVLDKVEEYGSNGKTLFRRIILSDGPSDVNPLKEVQVYNADGSYSARHLTDNKVDREDSYGAEGTLLTSKVYADTDEKPVEKIDKKLLECFHIIGHKFDNFD